VVSSSIYLFYYYIELPDGPVKIFPGVEFEIEKSSNEENKYRQINHISGDQKGAQLKGSYYQGKVVKYRKKKFVSSEKSSHYKIKIKDERLKMKGKTFIEKFNFIFNLPHSGHFVVILSFIILYFLFFTLYLFLFS
jgi:hypothetical protein